MKRIALTGGGTAGHVIPHFAIIPELTKQGWSAFYIGSRGIEKQIVTEAGIEFHEISAGKLRRYFSMENLVDGLRVMLGFCQALVILLRCRPEVIFSKGGFVSVPVCVAGRLLGIPVITHESDLTPGLATKIIARFANHILYTFAETKRYLPSHAVYVGAAVRGELSKGDRQRGLRFAGFDLDDARPVILVMGGSLGAQKINDCLLTILPDLLQQFRVVHLTGKGKSIPFEAHGYAAFEYVSAELKDLFAAADLVIARAGANSIFEFLSLRKPMLLVPLEAGSRGDQVHNAESFASQGWAMVLRESELTAENLLQYSRALHDNATAIISAQSTFSAHESIDKIVGIIEASACSRK